MEKTGVPAAQLLAEEMERKKKDEQKIKAIAEYKSFLSKFYGSGGSKKFAPIRKE